ncbi:MAG: NAD-dependent epimerase/dehydratase family protein [Nitrospinota bacterium]|nr:NAD-dependent epimerase/dehydratase family protein [Nitrospinota bacterium]
MSVALVTGATGVVGRYITDALLARDDRVRIVTRRSIKPWHANLEVVQGDLRDRQIIEDSLTGVDSVYHCAAEFHNQGQIWEANVHVTERLLEVLASQPTRYLCYMGSAGVLGASNDAWVDETTPCHPRDLYERSKWEAEKMVLSSSLNMNICVLRPVFVVAPERPGCLSYAIRDNWRDRLMIWVKGQERAHIIHAGDIATAAIHFQNRDLAQPQCFFVACDEDELSTLRGMYGYFHRKIPNSGGAEEIALPASLPLWIPHNIRTLRRGPSLHGRVRFSSRKLQDYGVRLPYGFRGAIDDIRSQVSPP